MHLRFFSDFSHKHSVTYSQSVPTVLGGSELKRWLRYQRKPWVTDGLDRGGRNKPR